MVEVDGFDCCRRLFENGGLVGAVLLATNGGISWIGLFVAGGTNVDVADVFGCREDVVFVGGTLDG